MKTYLAKLWPSLVTLGAGLILFLAPSVQAYAGAHPAYSVPILTLWGFFLHWAQSPRTPNPPPAPLVK
jgi:hypothetical protein